MIYKRTVPTCALNGVYVSVEQPFFGFHNGKMS